LNPIAIAFLAGNVLALLVLPRRLAPIPILLGACYVTRAQALELGPFHFTTVRVLIAVGACRVAIRGEWLKGGMTKLDVLQIAWGVWLLVSAAFHKDPSGQIVERLGIAFDVWGVYFLVRSFCRTWQETTDLCRMVGALLVPIAAEMIVEKITAHDFFAFLGGVLETPTIREGHVRAQGPFGHAILAGTIGAVCLPLALGLWRRHKPASLTGVAASLAMVYASTSSGPILSLAAGIGAMFLWPYRRSMRLIRWCAVCGYVALDIVMNDPAYFLMARIDLTGGSTGYFRAQLIQSSLRHASEWWLVGTDYTRHWMPSGVSWSLEHTDITNHYLYMGVLGGLPLLLLFVAILSQAFVIVGRSLRSAPEQSQFMIWSLGASLFAHAVTCISVSYFDQSVVFLYLTFGLIGSAQTWAIPVRLEADRAIPSPTARLVPTHAPGLFKPVMPTVENRNGGARRPFAGRPVVEGKRRVWTGLGERPR
jgi:hypothetical protein